jgi:hypothetical protein
LKGDIDRDKITVNEEKPRNPFTEVVEMSSKGMFWLLTLVVISGFLISIPSLHAQGKGPESQILTYAGKQYSGTQDPEYVSYDQALREYMVRRIGKKFGVTLDPKKYSGFDLLEIEALLKFKKADEPADLFLKQFPGHQ